MNRSLRRHTDSVTGMLSAFNQLLFRGTSRMMMPWYSRSFI
jgi:hypothetical protein